MIFEHQDYRTYLKTELARRCHVNPKYSLRSYAYQLKMSPGQLSRVLQGKKRMSYEKALEVSSILNLKGNKREYFCQLVHFDTAKNLVSKEYIENRLKEIRPSKDFYSLEGDMFKLISDWYHYAILELIEVKGFKPNPRWIAKKLGISQAEVELAIERLQRLKLLMCDGNQWRKMQSTYVASTDIPNEAFLKFHKQSLERALKSLDSQSVDERHMSSVTFGIDTSKLKEARELIRKFRGDMEKLLTKSNKMEVYQLAIQLFRATDKI